MSHSRILIMLLGVCMVVVYAYLLTDYFKQEKVQAAIINQTGDSSRVLALLALPPANLQAQLEQARIANQAARQAVSWDNINSTAIIKAVLQKAEACNLKANPLTADQWLKRNVGNKAYRILPLKLDLEGKLSDLTQFLGQLEDREAFPSLAIEDLSIDLNSQTDGSGKTSITSGVSAKLTVSIIVRLESGK